MNIQEKKHKEIRKRVREAARNGTTVPYSLEVMIDAGIGLTTIRKVKRWIKLSILIIS